MISHGKEVKVFSGNSNPALAESICNHLYKPLGKADIKRFADGECSVSILEPVRGADVFIVQSTCKPVNDNLMELLVMIDAMHRASAGRITAVIPYFGYARQDRKAKSRDPISAKLVANIIEAAGADRVLTMDLHANQIQGFFDIPVDNMRGAPLFADYYLQKFGKGNPDVMVVSPDVGSVARARQFAMKLNMNLAIVDKRREVANKSEVMNIIGNVEGKTVILLDDMVDTAGSLCGAARALIEVGGAKEIYACATHGVLSRPALERIEESPIKELKLCDTIPYPVGDILAKRCGVSINRLRSRALTARANIGGHDVLLVKPQTFMNLSGEAVRPLADYFKIPPERVLVVSDEVALVPGRLRMRASGSAGGHNGLKNIILHLGTENFPRLRVGVGSPPHPDYDMADWVMGVPRGEDAAALEKAEERAADAIECCVQQGIDRAMNRYNG